MVFCLLSNEGDVFRILRKPSILVDGLDILTRAKVTECGRIRSPERCLEAL